ncbi:MAG: hypothetical protein ACKOWF_04090, partial [Chloroflexota bacterium]
MIDTTSVPPSAPDREHPAAPAETPGNGFSLTVSGGVAPISAIACLDEARIVVITDGVARWLLQDGSPGPRVGGRARCRGRAISICVWGRAIGILHADPPGLEIVTSADEHLFSLDGILMPVTGGVGIAMNADTIAIAGEDPRVYLLDRRTLAIRDILHIRGAERIAAARDGAFWATIPRTGRLVRLGPGEPGEGVGDVARLLPCRRRRSRCRPRRGPAPGDRPLDSLL